MRGWRRRLSVAAIAIAAVTGAATMLLPQASVDAGEHSSDTEGWFNYVDYYVGSGDEVEAIRSRLLSELAGAETRIDAAIAELDDEEIIDALTEAAERGVRVRIVADEQFSQTPGFQALVDHSDVGVRFGNGELRYLPDPTLSPILEHCQTETGSTANPWVDAIDHVTCTRAAGGLIANTDNMMERGAHFNVMSHTFFLIDSTYVWNITAPLTDDQPFWLAFRAMSEELSNSYEREFRQMYGGVFATTLSVYNGPLKSITHADPMRLTNRGQLRLRFNPQERLVKNVIDEVYRARASVFIMTENLQNRDLINALRYKQEHGFDVRIVYGQGQGETALELLDDLGAIQAPAEMGRLPTFIVMDSERDRNNRRQPRMIQILSHELWRAEPFEILTRLPDDFARIYPSDTFADGVMWEIVENHGTANPNADVFVENWVDLWNQARGGN